MPLTRFFGRDTDIMHLVRMICPDTIVETSNPHDAPQRLITVTGTGGTGKTRLATEIGAMLSLHRQIPVTFVPLADISDPRRILDAMARALKLEVRDADNIVERIVSAISGELWHLLILDNLKRLFIKPSFVSQTRRLRKVRTNRKQVGSPPKQCDPYWNMRRRFAA